MMVCIVISLIYIKQIKNHTKSIIQFIQLVENIKILIEYKNLSVSELLDDACNSNNYTLLFFLEDIRKGIGDYHKTTENVFSNERLYSMFDYDDVEYMKGFFFTLGSSDVNGQIVNCNFYKNIFEKKLSQLQVDEKSKTKCISTLLTGIGILISIILI